MKKKNVRTMPPESLQALFVLYPFQKLYKEIDCLTLSEKRKCQKLVLSYKIVNGMAPNYLGEMHPQTVQCTDNL